MTAHSAFDPMLMVSWVIPFHMESQALTTHLLESGVLIENRRGDRYRLGDRFRRTVSKYEKMVVENEDPGAVFEGSGDDEEVTLLREIHDRRPSLVVKYKSFEELLDGIEHPELLQLAFFFEGFENDGPSANGSPDAFLPISTPLFLDVVDLCASAVVYIWVEDCEPCDAMVETLNEVFDERPRDTLLFSVYGPDHAELLENELDVSGGPTTLFVCDGDVDSRLLGSASPTVVEKEYGKICK